MTTYFFIFFSTFILSLCVKNKQEKQYSKSLFWVFIPLFMYGIFRTDCMDMSSYKQFFEETNGNQFYDSVNERMEIGYTYLNYILPNFRLLIAIQTFILVASYLFICKKYIQPKFLWLFIILLFLSGEKTVYFFTAMRNTTAIAILLFSLPFIEQRKIVCFAIMTFIASLFHTSAILFLPLAYIVGNNNKMNKTELIAWIGTLMFFLIIPVSTLVDKISIIISGSELDKYSSYLESSYEYGLLAKLSSIIFVGFILYDINKNPIDNTHLMLGRISLLFAYFPLLGTLNTRATYYYCIIILTYTIYILCNNKRAKYKFVFLILLIIYMAYSFFVVDASSSYSGLYTYKTLIDFNL